MKLVEALRTVRADRTEPGERFTVYLACGFTPLHLSTFLAAHLQALHPQRKVEVATGFFGDFVGNLERMRAAQVDAGAVVLEWAAVDPRLGLRILGRWDPVGLPDILSTVRERLERVLEALERAAEAVPVALCLPTLPLPPVSFTAGWQAGELALELSACVSAFAARAGRMPGIRVVSAQRLDCLSAPGERRDVKAEIHSGFPYRLPHAAAVGELLARLVLPPVPKKGLITDLDDTLWRGLVGEVGAAGVFWDLEHHGQIHGLYQQLLASLAASGLLLAVASKNDRALVDEVFRREDFLVPSARIFPIEIHWHRKSESVGRILRAWNIPADSVVFVDDSPMELAEVKAAHPEVECVVFPTHDAQAAYVLLERLRDLFGKEKVFAEDSIRLDSLRRAQALRDAREAASGSGAGFIQQLEAEITLNFNKANPDPRAFELVNKTNQFNLNGRRYTEAAWHAYLKQPTTFLGLVAYQDKYGPLGKIAVIAGRAEASTLTIDTWVMSCRALCRQIEHQCLQVLFERYDVQEITLAFEATPRNGPLREFLEDLAGAAPKAGMRITREAFVRRCPRLFSKVKELTDGGSSMPAAAVLPGGLSQVERR
jgi:FkbH-like protein